MEVSRHGARMPNVIFPFVEDESTQFPEVG